MENNQIINCSIRTCKFNNCDYKKCTLNEIDVSEQNNLEVKEAKESMCCSYECNC